jgi:hypothetical protein
MILTGMNGEQGGTDPIERDFQKMWAPRIEIGPREAAGGPIPEMARRPWDRRPSSSLPNGAWTLPRNRRLHF